MEEPLFKFVYRPGGNPVLSQLIEPIRHRLLQEQACKDCHDLLAMDDAIVVLDKSCVGRELRRAEYGAGARALPCSADHQHQSPVGAAEHAGRHAAIAPSAAPRRSLAVDEVDLEPMGE